MSPVVGEQINFRSFLIVNEAAILPQYFFQGTAVAQNCVLFGLLARDVDGKPLFPRRFGPQNRVEDNLANNEFKDYNGLLIHQIATKMGLLDRIRRQLEAFNELVSGKEEDKDDDEEEGEILSIEEIMQDVARNLGYPPSEIGYWDLMDMGGILASYRRETRTHKKSKRGVIRDYRTPEERKVRGKK